MRARNTQESLENQSRRTASSIGTRNVQKPRLWFQSRNRLLEHNPEMGLKMCGDLNFGEGGSKSQMGKRWVFQKIVRVLLDIHVEEVK